MIVMGNINSFWSHANIPFQNFLIPVRAKMQQATMKKKALTSAGMLPEISTTNTANAITMKITTAIQFTTIATEQETIL